MLESELTSTTLDPAYKKHRQPSLADEVWRLERIAKDGVFHKRLSSAGIFTVKDFLRLYVADPSSLRNDRMTVYSDSYRYLVVEFLTEHGKQSLDMP